MDKKFDLHRVCQIGTGVEALAESEYSEAKPGDIVSVAGSDRLYKVLETAKWVDPEVVSLVDSVLVVLVVTDVYSHSYHREEECEEETEEESEEEQNG